MIFCKDKIYAKVWKVTKNEKYIDLKISTSEKGLDGNRMYSNWFPRLIGHAFNSLKDTISEGDNIVITKSKFTNQKYTQENGDTKYSFRFLALEAEKDSDNQQPSQEKKEEKQPEPESTAKEESPW